MNSDDIKLKIERIISHTQEINSIMLQVEDKLEQLEEECYPPYSGKNSDQDIFSEVKQQFLYWSDRMKYVLDIITKQADATQDSLSENNLRGNKNILK